MRHSLKIFIGYDSREDIAWQVCRHSILRHASGDVTVLPLKQAPLRAQGLYTRPPDEAATAFSLTRFLTPFLAATEGWSIFLDCDFLVSRDITEIFALIETDKALYCVQHDYAPARKVKMDGQPQSVYPRKNWSSFMVFNGAHPNVKALTPNVVNRESPAFLHRMAWLDDDMIGGLDLEWNFLEGEYPRPDRQPICVHYTNGGPWFDTGRDCDFASEWRAERDLLLTGRGPRTGDD